MTYEQTIDYLFKKLPMFSRMGSAAYKKDLTNTLLLCNHLNNPQQHFKSIHIGGTNGKGSVSHMLAAILQTSGYKCGLYTSPHLHDFRERIKVNGEMADKFFVADFVQKIKPLIEEIEPSFFEITVAMAFEYFAQQNVDVAIVEVGLGGRLDSTNIINPEISVITNISYDHMDMLGNTLAKIAFEKAGIIKPNTPVVIGEKHTETMDVFVQSAKEKNAPVVFATDKYEVEKFEWEEKFLSVDVIDHSQKNQTNYQLDLNGIYQIKNLPAVLSTVDVLKEKGFIVSDNDVKEGLKTTKKRTGLKGRWDVLQTKPFIIADVAHNEAGIQQVMEQLKHQHFQQLHIVTGMVKDKDVNKHLNLLPSNAIYYFTQADSPRALPATELQQKASAFALYGKTYENVNVAIDAAKENATEEDLILIIGSIFMIAEIKETSVTA